MSADFYCDEILSGQTLVQIVAETDNVLAFYHTRPAYPTHIVAIPKQHIGSLLDFEDDDNSLLSEILSVIKQVSRMVVKEQGACRVVTNLGTYQDSNHLHWHIISGEANKLLPN